MSILRAKYDASTLFFNHFNTKIPSKLSFFQVHKILNTILAYDVISQKKTFYYKISRVWYFWTPVFYIKTHGFRCPKKRGMRGNLSVEVIKKNVDASYFVRKIDIWTLLDLKKMMILLLNLE